MKNRGRIVAFGVLGSLGLLVALAYFESIQAGFMELSTQWLVLSAVPLLTALFMAGYITRVKGFGVELESALGAPLASRIDLQAIDAISIEATDRKRSIPYLQSLTADRKRSIRLLSFQYGRRGFYSAHDVLQYLAELPNLEYFEIVTRDGKFVCYLPALAFSIDRPRFDENQFEIEMTDRFLRALSTARVLDEFPRIAVSVSARSSDALLEVLRLAMREQANIVAVLSDQGRYLGPILRNDLERKVAEAVAMIRSA